MDSTGMESYQVKLLTRAGYGGDEWLWWRASLGKEFLNSSAE